MAASLFLAGCQDDSAGPEEGVSVEDVAEADPDEETTEAAADDAATTSAGADDDQMTEGALLGQTVTVSGEVTEVVSEGAFWLGGEFDLFDEGVPVVSAFGEFTDMGVEDVDSLVESDTIVQVTGTVREFELLELEDEIGVDLDDSLYEDLEGEAVVMAEQVQTLAGEDVTTSGEVAEVLSPVSFKLAGAGWSVVVLDADQAQVDAGEQVEVTGTVRQMDIAEIEDDYGLDLEDDLYEEYEGDLVLVADTVAPVGATSTE